MSVMLARDPEVLQKMLEFYANNSDSVLDVTANQRRMWDGVEWGGQVHYMDIDAAMKPDTVADFRSIPFPDASFDVIVFDPPHLPVAAASPCSDKTFAANYGLGQSMKADNVSAYFAPFLTEAHRILKPDGLIFAKLKDFVHNHKYQWTLTDFVCAVREQPGLTPCDLIVKRDPSAGNMKSSKWINAHHVRNCHCWWIIVRKGKCESRKAAQ
jgi:SAM-dependent methyltransferase